MDVLLFFLVLTPDPLCPDSTHTTYVANPYNCSNFYECRYGIKHLIDCPEDYRWDRDLEECNIEDKVDCSCK